MGCPQQKIKNVEPSITLCFFPCFPRSKANCSSGVGILYFAWRSATCCTFEIAVLKVLNVNSLVLFTATADSFLTFFFSCHGWKGCLTYVVFKKLLEASSFGLMELFLASSFVLSLSSFGSAFTAFSFVFVSGLPYRVAKLTCKTYNPLNQNTIHNMFCFTLLLSFWTTWIVFDV